MDDYWRPKKSLGQHWLHDKESLHSICEAAELTKTDTVLEVGPGMGTLTKELVKRANKVISVEFDQKLANELSKQEIAKNLQIIAEDIRKFDLSQLPEGYKVVANIPYYLTSNLIRQLSEAINPPSLVVLLIQKEVALRVAAKPGDMSLLSVTVQHFWDVSLGVDVPARLFTPKPKVDSKVLILKRKPITGLSEELSKRLFSMARMCFAARRKTLLNSLSAGLRLDKTVVKTALDSIGVDPTARPQKLSMSEWHKLSNLL